jgi:hypothetical protein
MIDAVSQHNTQISISRHVAGRFLSTTKYKKEIRPKYFNPGAA